MKKIILLLLFLLLTFVLKPVFGATYPSPTGFVNDFAAILTADQKNELENNLSNFERQTGNEISVAIVKDLGGNTVENYAVGLLEQWKIGKKDKDNGLLFLIAINDHKYRFEVSYGLEPILTDAKTGDIGRNIVVPAFKNGDYYSGIKNSLLEIEGVITKQTPPGSPVSVLKRTFDVGEGIVYFIVFFLFFFSWAISAIVLRITKFLDKSPGYWAGPLGGIITGGIIGLLIGGLIGAIITGIIIGLFGLLLDLFASKIYGSLSVKRKSGLLGTFLGFWGTGSGFHGRSSSGFGGFSGGSSGGGGSSGSW